MKIQLSILLVFMSITLAVVAQVPKITNISQINTLAGATLTLTGNNFNTTPTNNVVFFGAVATVPTISSTTSLTVTVPIGATYGNIRVLDIITGLSGSSTQYFNAIFTPTKGTIGITDLAAKQDFATGSLPHTVAIGDIDGDGKPDMVIANYSNHTVSILRNNSSSGSITATSFDPKVDFATGTYPRSVSIGDLDGDGKPDLVVANYNSNNVSILRNTAIEGSITTSSFAAKVDFTTGANPCSVAIGDLDGDGKPDLAIANFSSNNVSVLRNISMGIITATSFTGTRVDFATGGNPYSVALGDLDGDGKADIVVANYTNDNVSVLRNNASPGSITNISFASKVDFGAGTNPCGVAIGDLDGDGKLDLAITNFNSNSVSVLRNIAISGSITSTSFVPKIDYVTANNPIDLAIGDIDGDGKADIVIANYNSNNISVLHNAFSGNITAASFDAKVNFTTGAGSNSIAIGDLDGDGKVDIAVANRDDVSVSILRNDPQFGPLPVNFGKLTAIIQSKYVKLNWNTFSEINNVGFIIYRSSDGINYTEINWQGSKGNGANTYTANDIAPKSGVNYYRLSQKDNDGTITKLADEAVNFSLLNEELKTWPNPVNKTLSLSFTVGKYQRLELSDITGKKLQELNISNTENGKEINMSNYPKGIYMIGLKGSQGNHIAKVIK